MPHDLTVFGEVGAKSEANDAATLIAQAEKCLDSGCTMCAIHDLETLLIGEFGVGVIIAKVMPDDVMETEALRAGLSVIHVGDGNHAAHAG